MHPNSYYEELQPSAVNESQQQLGVLRDGRIQLGFPAKKISKVNCRLICFQSTNGKYLEFITNDFESDPSLIAQLYQKRWNIELLFKRLKQNMPLQYFLGDNQNAIRIQIWCALIADLLLQVVRKQVNRRWAFSTIVSIVRLHLFNYLNLISFLENPESCTIRTSHTNPHQFKLKFSG